MPRSLRLLPTARATLALLCLLSAKVPSAAAQHEPVVDILRQYIGHWESEGHQTQGRLARFLYDLTWLDRSETVAEMVIRQSFANGETDLLWRGFKAADRRDGVVGYTGHSVDGRSAQGVVTVSLDSLATEYDGWGPQGPAVRIRDVFGPVIRGRFTSITSMRTDSSWRELTRDHWTRMESGIPIEGWTGLHGAEDSVIRAFLGPDGVGARHAGAPVEIDQFGRLVGVWRAQQEVLTETGTWRREPAALWVWQWTLGGFATTDLWYQDAQSLPSYLEGLGRPYMLSAIRVFDRGRNTWQVAWMTNGGGAGPGADFGVFTGHTIGGDIVMSDPGTESAVGRQRVVFSDIDANRFRWRSEYSQDGGTTWTVVMRVDATRIR